MSWIKSNDISSKKHSSPSFYICGGFKFISLLSNKDVINQAHMHAIALYHAKLADTTFCTGKILIKELYT